MNTLLIINPVSGRKKGRHIFEKLKPLFLKNQWKFDITVSEDSGFVYDLGKNTDFSRYEKVVIVGGDGTVNEFVNGMLKRPDGKIIPIGIIPAGTGNSLMHDLGLLDPHLAVESIVSGASRKIDLAKVTSELGVEYAFNVVGWGLPSTINQKSEHWKLLGGQRYNMASLQEIIRNPSWPVEIKMDNKVLRGRYSFFLACNTIHTGKGMKIAPGARLDDGKLDLVILKQASRLQLIKLFSKIFKGEHIGHPLVEHHQVTHFSLKDESPGPLIIDGQIASRSPFEVQVLKQALKILH